MGYPQYFPINRAQPQPQTRTFDPESIDRLDYLIYCLKQQGIYVYLDMLTYRQFRPDDGVDEVDRLGQAAKPYTYFDPKLIELQKEFARDLWTHTNPYTKLAYKDDPAIALTGIKNESDLFTQHPILEPYRSQLEEMYRDRAKEKALKVAPTKIDFAAPGDQEAQFLIQVMQDFYADMIIYLREIGVQIPIAGTNWSRNLGVSAAQLTTDFTDSHCYWNFPRWETGETQTTPMVSAPSNTFATLSSMRFPDRPFFVSEWDHAWPDEWRAETSLAYAAIGSLQGWSGFSIHTYRYATWGPVDSLGGGTSTINSITYRNHFDAFNDPAKFGLFYHAALIFRRGDVRPAEKRAVIKVAEELASWRFKRPEDIPALRWVEKHQIGLSLPGTAYEADMTISPDNVEGLGENELSADTGELWRSWTKRIGWIDTPRTKAAYGFLGGAGKIGLSDFGLEVETDFAVIALSSLTDDPITQSETLLLTAVGRCDNSEAQYDEAHRQQFDFGHAPILIEPIQAHIDLHTVRPNLKVWVISDKGEAVTRLATEYKDGVLHFEIGPQPRWNPSTMYYLIRI